MHRWSGELLTPADRPIANPIVVLREEFDDWAILFNPETAAAVGINPVGVAVWKGIDGRKSLAEIAADVAVSFDDAPAAVVEEITAFVNTLAEDGYVGTAAEG
jgi:SynChlorMet cassette protein ScmD